MLNAGRIERRRGHVILQAIGLAFSSQLPDETWYDALADTPEAGEMQRQIDANKRQFQEKSKRLWGNR